MVINSPRLGEHIMRSRLAHLRRDERGMSFVWVGIGFMTFFAASTLAIDVGMFMTAVAGPERR